MAPSKRSVLITGCSEGGMGSALAVAFHSAGLHVHATARSLSKMSHLSSLGISTHVMDIESASSIAACISSLSSLDILVNNAGTSASMPISDLDLEEAKKIFDVNVWAQLAVTQACLPLLLNSKGGGMIVNQTSVVSVVAGPFQSVYNSSKAAMAMFTDCLRLELAPFNITVIEMKTGAVASNMIMTQRTTTKTTLPKGSIYEPARETVESTMRMDKMGDVGMPAQPWATQVVSDLLKKTPPNIIWRGTHARMGYIGTLLPASMLEGPVKKLAGLDVVEQKVRKARV